MYRSPPAFGCGGRSGSRRQRYSVPATVDRRAERVVLAVSRQVRGRHVGGRSAAGRAKVDCGGSPGSRNEQELGPGEALASVRGRGSVSGNVLRGSASVRATAHCCAGEPPLGAAGRDRAAHAVAAASPSQEQRERQQQAVAERQDASLRVPSQFERLTVSAAAGIPPDRYEHEVRPMTPSRLASPRRVRRCFRSLVAAARRAADRAERPARHHRRPGLRRPRRSRQPGHQDAATSTRSPSRARG